MMADEKKHKAYGNIEESFLQKSLVFKYRFCGRRLGE